MSRPGIHLRDVLPVGWKGFFSPGGRVGIGSDLGTTEKAKSNPTAVTVTQEIGLDYFARLVIRFKSNKPETLIAVLEMLLDLPHDLKVAKICLDATSERFYAAAVRKYFLGRVTVVPVVSSETILHQSQKMTYKSYLGNLMVNAISDGRYHLPSSAWLEKDLRSVKNDKGSFSADVDEDGNHADCFDSTKLSLYSLIKKGGAAGAAAARVGNYGGNRPERVLKNPFASKFESKPKRAV
jgi:hypothetical protein